MTGRELIIKIATSCLDLDSPVWAELLYRDEEGSVIRKDAALDYNFINGKLKIEMDTIRPGI